MNNNNLNTERSASGVSEAHLLGWIRRTGSEVDLSYRTAIQYVGGFACCLVHASSRPPLISCDAIQFPFFSFFFLKKKLSLCVVTACGRSSCGGRYLRDEPPGKRDRRSRPRAVHMRNARYGCGRHMAPAQAQLCQVGSARLLFCWSSSSFSSHACFACCCY
jgi:hypothetical protein